MTVLCLAGDVMTGRGVDQALPSPGDPRLWERQVRDAREYLALAERVNGPLPRPTPPGWPWGDALALLDGLAPHVRIVNLETSVTARGAPAAGKAVHYRMHPANIGCLTAAHLDACAVANNHVLDFGPDGLVDTVDTLTAAGLPAVGAGRTAASAHRAIRIPGIVLLSCGLRSSGIPPGWRAGAHRAGVHLLPDLDDATAERLAERAQQAAAPGDVLVVSIHWGPNWGYNVPAAHVRFAHRLADAGVHVVHGHSAHHPLPIEIYRGRLILYGCGDLIDDYEGIGGHERYRDDLRLLYLATVEDGRLAALRIAPFQARQLRLRHASPADVEWLRELLATLSHRAVCRARNGLLELSPEA